MYKQHKREQKIKKNYVQEDRESNNSRMDCLRKTGTLHGISIVIGYSKSFFIQIVIINMEVPER